MTKTEKRTLVAIARAVRNGALSESTLTELVDGMSTRYATRLREFAWGIANPYPNGRDNVRVIR